MFEMVSMPVYETIAMETLARKLPQVGATPQWMLRITVWMSSSRKIPRMTRTTWVTRSSMARDRLRTLDSWIPTTFTTASTTIRTTVASSWLTPVRKK